MNELPNKTIPAAAPNHRVNSRAWIVLGLLLIFISWGSFYVPARTISYLLYYLNWHHWPWWYALNLWIIAFGTICVYAIKGQKILFYVKFATLISVITITIIYSEWIHLSAYRVQKIFSVLYRKVIVSYFYAPITDFFTDGTISVRLFISPLCASAAIALLLFWNHKKSKASRNTRIGKQETKR